MGMEYPLGRGPLKWGLFQASNGLQQKTGSVDSSTTKHGNPTKFILFGRLNPSTIEWEEEKNLDILPKWAWNIPLAEGLWNEAFFRLQMAYSKKLVLSIAPQLNMEIPQNLYFLADSIQVLSNGKKKKISTFYPNGHGISPWPRGSEMRPFSGFKWPTAKNWFCR